MSKEKIRGFIVGVIVMTLAFSMSISAYALIGSKSITASYNNIKIYIDQKLITPKDVKGNTVEPFIYNGTTYLPVRAVGEALGKAVSWNGTTNSVYVGTQPGAATGYSRNNPAPNNVALTVNYVDYFDSYNATVTVTQIIRGAEAWSMIQDANQFNEQPKDGYEYILVKIKVTMNSVKDDAAFDMASYEFQSFNADNAEYNNMTSVVTPDPTLDGQMYAGATKEGYLVFEVKTDDAKPKIVFGSQYDGSDGIWFRLY